jgi:hypothetical protein
LEFRFILLLVVIDVGEAGASPDQDVTMGALSLAFQWQVPLKHLFGERGIPFRNTLHREGAQNGDTFAGQCCKQCCGVCRPLFRSDLF